MGELGGGATNGQIFVRAQTINYGRRAGGTKRATVHTCMRSLANLRAHNA